MKTPAAYVAPPSGVRIHVRSIMDPTTRTACGRPIASGWKDRSAASRRELCGNCVLVYDSEVREGRR